MAANPSSDPSDPSAPSDPPIASSRSSLVIIFLIVFIDLLGFGIVIPILPYYAQAYGASAWQLGWLMTCYSLMQFLVAPIWGRVSDRYGRRPVLLISLLGSSISLAMLGLAPSLAWLFVARTFAGICGANISTAYAYVADVTTEQNRAKGMGMIGAGFGLGFIFGPAIGGVLSRYGYATPMLVGSAMALANCVFGWFRLEEPPGSAAARAANRVKRFDLVNIRQTLGTPRTRVAIGMFFLLTFAVTQMEVVFAIFMRARYGYDAHGAGWLLALMGVLMVSVQGGAIGKLAKRFGEPKLIVAGFALCAIGLYVFAGFTSIPLVVIGLSILALGHGTLHPSLSSLASKGASPERHGATMGVFQSAGSLARVLGPPIAGFLYDAAGMATPFYAGCVLLVIGLGVALRTRARSSAATGS